MRRVLVVLCVLVGCAGHGAHDDDVQDLPPVPRPTETEVLEVAARVQGDRCVGEPEIWRESGDWLVLCSVERLTNSWTRRVLTVRIDAEDGQVISEMSAARPLWQ